MPHCSVASSKWACTHTETTNTERSTNQSAYTSLGACEIHRSLDGHKARHQLSTYLLHCFIESQGGHARCCVCVCACASEGPMVRLPAWNGWSVLCRRESRWDSWCREQCGELSVQAVDLICSRSHIHYRHRRVGHAEIHDRVHIHRHRVTWQDLWHKPCVPIGHLQDQSCVPAVAGTAV